MLYVYDKPGSSSNEVDIYYVEDFEATTDGLLLTATYDFPSSVTDSETYFLIGVGVYESDFNYKMGKEDEDLLKLKNDDDTLGVKLGLKSKYYLSDNLSLSGRIMYRWANVDNNLGEMFDHNIVDYTGAEFSGGLELEF